VVARIEALRRERKWSARLIAAELNADSIVISPATVGRWLARLGISRRRDLDPDGESNRAPGKITARYPGHMIHVDVKKVGRIPDGGGWRAHGRGSDADRAAGRAKTAAKKTGTKAGYVYLHSAIDGFSRLAYTEPLANETAKTAIGFFARARAFFQAHGINRITRVVTDNGACYRAAAFTRSLFDTARHQRTSPSRLSTTARSSATNGSWPKNCSTPAPGPPKPNEPRPSASGWSTTTTTDHTPPPGTDHRPHASTPASPTS